METILCVNFGLGTKSLPSRRGNQLNGNWSAWLGEYEDKIVIAPQFESFTGVCGWGFEGLIPNNWIVL